MELKMDAYNDLNEWVLIRWRDVPSGFKVLRTLWAFKIKFDADGIFLKLNPRLCIVGTGMDREVYDSFSDVLRWETLLVLVAIRANYKGIRDFHFDVKDAFQATRTDTAQSEAVRNQPKVYCHQAPGFVELDPDGVPYVCEVNTAHQGRIDSARLFGQEFGASCLKIGCYRSTWDNELWLKHNGPKIDSPQDLEKVIAMTANMPAGKGEPLGFIAFGRHVDDGMGIATSQALIDWVVAGLERDGWTLKVSGWEKMLGYTCNIRDEPTTSTVTISCYPYLENLARVHFETETVVKPKHPYPTNILQIQAGVPPPEHSPEHAYFLEMQEKCRSGLGSSIWAMRAYPKLVYPTNYLCAYMSNPSCDVYKAWKHAIMHELAYPRPLTFGGYGHGPLVTSETVIRPFTDNQHELGFHVFFDANLGAPRRVDMEAQGSIAQGTVPTDPPAAAKSITGGVAMLGGGPVGIYCLRQQLKPSDSHVAEISAGGTVLHRVIPTQGLLQECLIPQLRPTPLFTDSQSTMFCANSAASSRLSVWVNRRSAVLREAVDTKIVSMEKIGDPDNVANYFTKPVTTVVMNHYFDYILPSGRQHSFLDWSAGYTSANATKRLNVIGSHIYPAALATQPLIQVVAASSLVTPSMLSAHLDTAITPALPTLRGDSVRLNMEKVPSQATGIDVTVTGDPVAVHDDPMSLSQTWLKQAELEWCCNVVPNPSYSNSDVVKVALGRRLYRQRFMNRIAIGQVALPSAPEFAEHKQALVTKWLAHIERAHVPAVHCVTPTPLWCVHPKHQCYIAVGEIVKMPDGAIGDIVCVSDKLHFL